MTPRKSDTKNKKGVLAQVPVYVGILGALIIISLYISLPKFLGVNYDTNNKVVAEIIGPAKWKATHVATPMPVKAVYMSACYTATPKLREKIKQLAIDTEINSIVIDIKDYTGTIAFEADNPILKGGSTVGCRVSDMRDFVEDLHKHNIYVIGRITVFQDPYYTSKRPDLAVHKKDGSVWKDHKGLSFIDVSAKEYWDYIVALSHESYAAGFDELNFDYIRFPSDGNMKDIAFPWSGTTTKAVALENFFYYLHKNLATTTASRPVLSADLFGMTTTNTDDLNIGQVLERALPYFDYIAPMVYPSHYPPHFNGYTNPAAMPYEVVKYSMDRAFLRASTTPLKLRPWLQDFNMGATYTADMVRKQIQAVYDSGLEGWMLWDAANTYTARALLPDEKITTQKPAGVN